MDENIGNFGPFDYENRLDSKMKKLLCIVLSKDKYLRIL